MIATGRAESSLVGMTLTSGYHYAQVFRGVLTSNLTQNVKTGHKPKFLYGLKKAGSMSKAIFNSLGSCVQMCSFVFVVSLYLPRELEIPPSRGADKIWTSLPAR